MGIQIVSFISSVCGPGCVDGSQESDREIGTDLYVPLSGTHKGITLTFGPVSIMWAHSRCGIFTCPR